MRLRRRALTLFEVLIAISLIAMLLGALLSFFWQTLQARETAAYLGDRTQIAQQVLERMAAELRASVALDQSGFSVQQFSGTRRKVTFLAAPLPPDSGDTQYGTVGVGPLPLGDLREISYELWIDPDQTTESGDPVIGGILRTERRPIEPAVSEEDVSEDAALEYLRRDLWSHELGYLEFRYFDGVEWSTTWEVKSGNAVPHLVQVTVGFDSLTKFELEDQDLEEERATSELDRIGPPVKTGFGRYSTIVRLPAADVMFAARLNKLGDQAEEVYSFVNPQAAGEGGAGQPPTGLPGLGPGGPGGAGGGMRGGGGMNPPTGGREPPEKPSEPEE